MLSINALAGHANASSINWNHDLTSAATSASNAGKPLLVKVSATWCGPCKRMQRETFSDERVVEHISQCFVPVSLDGDRDKRLVRQLGVSAYPTTLVVSSDLNIVKRIRGFRSASQLAQELGDVCQHSSSAPVRNSGQALSPFHDWCPVSPVVDQEFTRGDRKFRASYRGYSLSFRSDRHRQMFFKEPNRFWPVADGRCVVSWLDEGTPRQGQMQFGLEHQGLIWFFASHEVRERFAKDPDAYVEQLLNSGQPTH